MGKIIYDRGSKRFFKKVYGISAPTKYTCSRCFFNTNSKTEYKKHIVNIHLKTEPCTTWKNNFGKAKEEKRYQDKLGTFYLIEVPETKLTFTTSNYFDESAALSVFDETHVETKKKMLDIVNAKPQETSKPRKSAHSLTASVEIVIKINDKSTSIPIGTVQEILGFLRALELGSTPVVIEGVTLCLSKKATEIVFIPTKTVKSGLEFIRTWYKNNKREEKKKEEKEGREKLEEAVFVNGVGVVIPVIDDHLYIIIEVETMTKLFLSIIGMVSTWARTYIHL